MLEMVLLCRDGVVGLDGRKNVELFIFDVVLFLLLWINVFLVFKGGRCVL